MVTIYGCSLWSPTLMVDKAVGGRGLVIWSVFVVVDHWYMVTNSLMFIRSRQHFESTLHSQIKDFASETPQNVLGAAFVGSELHHKIEFIVCNILGLCLD